jgi:hypothetical protein
MEELLVVREWEVDEELTDSSSAAPTESTTNREITAARATLERPRLDLGRWLSIIICSTLPVGNGFDES